MGVRAGAVRQFILNGREMDPGPDSNWNISLPGFNPEVSSTGNGQAHVKGTRKLGGISGGVLSLDPARQDLEFLQSIASGMAQAKVQVTLIDGTVYAGDGYLVGEFQHATGDGTVDFDFMAPNFAQL